ncbi:MAG: hypothetical protein O7C98_08145 [Planctomycetota bacterium]|nr:hypothetical protein [Planctomycetota bacterium]
MRKSRILTLLICAGLLLAGGYATANQGTTVDTVFTQAEPWGIAHCLSVTGTPQGSTVWVIGTGPYGNQVVADCQAVDYYTSLTMVTVPYQVTGSQYTVMAPNGQVMAVGELIGGGSNE